MSIRTLLAATALATVSSAFASGGSPDPFKTEVSCLGTHPAGTAVPYTIEVEERDGVSHVLDYTVEIQTPGGATYTLASGTGALPAGRTFFLDRTVRVPALAPTGRYTILITSHSPTWSFSDTCSFHVI